MESAPLPRVNIGIHGGEPLLAGKDRIRQFVHTMRDSIRETNAQLRFIVQTNGTYIDESWLDFFDDLNIYYGITLDGNQQANDRHRVLHDQTSSFDKTYAAVLLSCRAESGKRRFRGIISVIDLSNDPVKQYDFFNSIQPPKWVLNLPNATRDTPPPCKDLKAENSPYGDWLIRLFDHWFYTDKPLKITIFEYIIESLLGYSQIQNAVAEGPGNILTIESDGEIQDIDLLKWTYKDSAVITGPSHVPNVNTDYIVDVVSQSYAIDKFNSHTMSFLPQTCRQCNIKSICGGGLVGHRYDSRNGFDNPSVYCKDIKVLVDHIRRAVAHNLQSNSVTTG